MRRKDREIKDTAGIEGILKNCKTCRLAMIDGDSPYVVPLSYGYGFPREGVLELYFHSAREGRKLDALRRNNKVCFDISREGEIIVSEDPCSCGYYYESVIGFGDAEFVTDPAEKCAALSAIYERQTGDSVSFTEGMAESVCVIKVVSRDFTGKKKAR